MKKLASSVLGPSPVHLVTDERLTWHISTSCSVRRRKVKVKCHGMTRGKQRSVGDVATDLIAASYEGIAMRAEALQDRDGRWLISPAGPPALRLARLPTRSFRKASYVPEGDPNVIR